MEASAIDGDGLSGGLLAIWNPIMDDWKSFHTCVGLLKEGRIKGFEQIVRILNRCGPYKIRQEFSDAINAYGILRDPMSYLSRGP